MAVATGHVTLFGCRTGGGSLIDVSSITNGLNIAHNMFETVPKGWVCDEITVFLGILGQAGFLDVRGCST